MKRKKGVRAHLSALPITKISSRYLVREIPLHALIVLSGHSKETSESYYYSGRTKEFPPYVGWQYTLSGKGCIEEDSECHDLLPGSLMIVTIPGSHNYYLPKNEGHWEFAFLTMIGREAVRMNKIIEKRIGNVINEESIPLTLSLFREVIEKLFRGGIESPFENSSYTYRLLMQLLAEIGGSRAAAKDDYFIELRKFIKQNVFREILVEEMAEVMHLSCSHFNRIFNKEMGVSPRVYLEDLRLKLAVEMLFEKTTTVKETAACCGFYDSNYFCRVFKKRYGISPGRYRELIN